MSNDTFRKEYTPLSEDQKSQMGAVKDMAESLEGLLNGVLDPNERSERARCIAVAKTNLETTIMWAVKGITSNEVSHN